MSALHALAPIESFSNASDAVDREAIAYVLAGWSGVPFDDIDRALPPNLDRSVVRAQAASWLEALAIIVTAERIDALVHLGVRRVSSPRLRTTHR